MLRPIRQTTGPSPAIPCAPTAPKGRARASRINVAHPAKPKHLPRRMAFPASHGVAWRGSSSAYPAEGRLAILRCTYRRIIPVHAHAGVVDAFAGLGLAPNGQGPSVPPLPAQRHADCEFPSAPKGGQDIIADLCVDRKGDRCTSVARRRDQLRIAKDRARMAVHRAAPAARSRQQRPASCRSASAR
jgi:hypothetical protein